MTPVEILALLPNGLHDADILRLGVDLAAGSAVITLRVLVGMPDADTEDGREAMRSCVLKLAGVTSIRIEPPADGYAFAMDGGVDADGGFGSCPGDRAAPDDGLVRLWFYISTWNARMMFTAKDCELEW